jgi:hypothetical protein
VTSDSAVKARKLAFDLAPTDFRQALAVARGIDDGWYLCQSLSAVARFAPPGRDFESTIDEALQACWTAANPYKLVAVSAWPLRALIERGNLARLDELLSKLVDVAAQIDHPVSRMDALGSLLEAVFPAGDPYRRILFKEYEGACKLANSWKAGRGISQFALMLAPFDPETARSAIEGLPAGPYKRRALRELDARQFPQARNYY